MKAGGLWAKQAISTIEIATPTNVPTKRQMPLDSTMPGNGLETISTVTTEEPGLSSSSANET